MMFWPPLCLLLIAIPSRVLVQSISDGIAVVEVSDGRIFLPSAASVCSTITTTINDVVDYIPVPCTDIAHPAIWSEEVIVDGTTAELIIAPSGNVRFVSETWLNASPPASIPTSSQNTFYTNATASSTASAFRRNAFSSYASPNSTSGVVMSSGEARSSSPTSAAKTSVYFSNATSGSGTSSMSLSTTLSFFNKSSGSVTSSISIRTGLISYESAATSNSANLTWSSSTRAGLSLVTTESNLFSRSSYTSSSNITFGYTTSSVTRPVNTNRESSSSQLNSNSSSSPFLSSSPSTIPNSQSSHETGNNASNTPSTKGSSSATTSKYSVSVAAFATTISSPSIPTITPPPKSSVFTSGNFTPPISSDLAAFETSGPSLITLNISGQSIVLMRQTMSGFENFTGTTTVTTSEATTNSAGAIAWVTGSVIIGTDGVSWGLSLGSIGTGKFCIWPFCSGGGKSGSGICIWPFCGGTGGGVTGSGGGGGGEGGEGGEDGDNNNSSENDEQTQPDQTTQEQKTAQNSNPSSIPTLTSTLPKSTAVSTTSSAPACPLFSIPSDSLTDDGSPTWNPSDPEYAGDIVAAAYAIWQVDSGSGSEILPPLPASTGSGDAVLIGFIPNAGSGGGNSTNGTLSSTNNSTSSTTTMTITPMPGAVNSAAAAASAASVILASSASLASVQSVESAQEAASASSVLSAAMVISSLSVASAASAASALSVASSLSAASALSVASKPTLTPNLAIIIIRNDYCDDVSCGSTGYIYDVTPLSPIVSDICTNASPKPIASFQYTEDVSNEPDDYPINSGKFTSHGLYTNCQYVQNTLEVIGAFWCDQVGPVWCSVPTMPEYSCTDSHSIDEDDEVPIVYCQWVGTITATRTTSAAPPATSSPRTCQVQTTFAGRGIVTGHWCKCSDGTKPAAYVSGTEWTCPDEIAS